MLEKLEALGRLAEHVRAAGYKALIARDNHIETAMGGHTVLIFCDPSISNIQFYAGFSDQVSDRFNLPHANAFNDAWKFTKCIVKDSGAVSFEADFRISLEREDAGEEVAQMIGTWEITLGAGVRALRDSQDFAT